MKVSPRHKARELAMQALYSWQMSGNAVEQIELAIATSNDMQKVDMSFFQDILRNALQNLEDLDKAVKPYLGRLPEEIDPVEKAIIRVATYELVHRIDVPYKVVINEAIELAKEFGAADSHKFVNGVLDKAVKTFRKDERT
ncbi:transcription antitermination factor NusB [Paraneptunicella aestuarii]|uniref:transcription antitermination factor NusB n=1 Tax=Paraneptunicella aestuarii TaxID=2831148 RepID=UPI001E575D93|nr:transcription antitermination factor NusB [Paraneptunicella aestuarii]UAA37544.1 transcription antitermination factor NusB [Paraneptunicella aestuarii]